MAGDNFQAQKFFLEPGYMICSEENYLIHTVLGSCVSICLWDKNRGIGGMNHYIYPRAGAEKTARFGDIAIPHLIQLLKTNGSEITGLQAHIIGGSENPELNSIIGRENIQIAQTILQEQGISIATVDVGGTSGRKAIFNNLSGELLVYKGIQIRRIDWYSDIR